MFYTRLKDFTSVKIYIIVIWVITPCSLVSCKENISQEYAASMLKVEDGGFFDKLLATYLTTQCRNPDDHNLRELLHSCVALQG